jgi:agmatinase
MSSSLVPPGASFLGAEIATDPVRASGAIAILGIPYGVAYPWSSTSEQCAAAPAAVRERSQRLARFRGHWDFDIDAPMFAHDVARRLVDCGDVPGAPDDASGNVRAAEDAVRALLAVGATPIVLGGDDSVPIPVIRAFRDHGPISVLQVDAHLDFRDEVGGIRDGYSSPMRRASEMDHVARIVQVGLRGVGSARPADVDDARGAGNILMTARELRERGVSWALAQLPEEGPVFVSFDLDGLDPSVMPAVSAPAPGGLGWDDAVDLVGAIGPRVAGAAFTEFVPALDTSGVGALVVARLVSMMAAAM